MSGDELTWVKSSSSHTGGCVELAALPGGAIALRDSKNPKTPALHFTGREMTAFIEAASRGEFDYLIMGDDDD